MIRSMTGFGVASADAEGGSFSVEVRSVNNKFFKATMRVPDALGALELKLTDDEIATLERPYVPHAVAGFN